MSISETLAANVVNTRYSDLSQENIDRAKIRILDALGCLIGGAEAAGCGGLLNLVRQWGGAAESHVLIHGLKVPAHNAAMLNSLMTRSYDFEPVEAEGEKGTGPAHISGTTVPTALTMAEKCGAGGKEMITALCLGDDLASRLSIASGFDFALGWDNTGTINKFGATAIAARLLKLNQKQVHNAFGIVLNQLAGSMVGVWDKTLCFKLPIALASRDAIFAAELAQQGYSGVKDPFTGQRGFFDLYCRDYDSSNLARDLGRRYYADCVIKPYPCCRATHSAIDAALKIIAEHQFTAEDIADIELNTPPAVLNLFVAHPMEWGETPQVNAAFSLRFTVANALLRKAVLPQHFNGEAVRDAALVALIDKVRMPGSLAPQGQISVDLKVKLNDGQVFSAQTGIARGDIARNPLSREEIIAKFRNNVAFSGNLASSTGEKVLETVEKLEELENVRDLVQLLIR